MKYLFIIFLFTTASATAQDQNIFFDNADDFFQKYVENGRVKYEEIRQNPKALNNIMAEAKKVKISAEDESRYKAFWINAYNLAVIAGIVESYPVASPLAIKGFFDTRRFSLGGRSVTLDGIEKELLFGKFPEEERFHFVLVCAAVSCPPLLKGAYRPEVLEMQLEKQTGKALNDPQFVRVGSKKVLFSEILKWYQDEFISGGKTLIEYVNQFKKSKIPEDLEIGFYEYNWELNEI